MNSLVRSPRALSLGAAALAALGMLTGCTPERAPEPTPSALFASDEEAFAAAEATYRAYTDALNKVNTSDPKTFEPVLGLGVGEFAARDKENLSWMHAENLTLGGKTVVTSFIGVTAEKRRSSITGIVCVDVSSVTLVDGSGQSKVNPARPDRYAMRAVFEDHAGELRIASAAVVEDPKCTA